MNKMNIAFIGAGNVASGLGNLLSKSGNLVKYGTQNPSEAQVSMADAIDFGDIICFAIPYSAMNGVLQAYKDQLKGKIVVDITNPINSSDWSPIFLGEDSGGEQTARILSESRVVKAFNTIFADVMKEDGKKFNGQKLTAFIATNDNQAGETIKEIAQDIGFNAVVINDIKNARYLEAMAHLNIAIALEKSNTDAGFTYLER